MEAQTMEYEVFEGNKYYAVVCTDGRIQWIETGELGFAAGVPIRGEAADLLYKRIEAIATCTDDSCDHESQFDRLIGFGTTIDGRILA
jgi:hypothetical protein